MLATDTENTVRTVACLHSSGSSGRQWNALRDYIGERRDVLTPNLAGYGDALFEYGESLRMEDEVESVAEHIMAAGGKAHLVGHSYGGAVAAHVALWRPELVASLTLYEPVLFSLLYHEDRTAISAGEVERVAHSVRSQLDSIYGRWQGARDFVNYWSGRDAWRHLEDHQHARLASQMPKVAAEFAALVEIGTSAEDLSALSMPVRLFCGAATRKSVRQIMEELARAVPGAELHWFDGLGHMGPVTHPDIVNPKFLDHIVDNVVEEAAVA
jgi:pimeloyl-ACP methyl ester carboxylesterase